MTTALLILAIIAVLTALVVVIGQSCQSGSMWLFYAMCNTPGALLELLGSLLSALFTND